DLGRTFVLVDQPSRHRAASDQRSWRLCAGEQCQPAQHAGEDQVRTLGHRLGASTIRRGPAPLSDRTGRRRGGPTPAGGSGVRGPPYGRPWTSSTSSAVVCAVTRRGLSVWFVLDVGDRDLQVLGGTPSRPMWELPG